MSIDNQIAELTSALNRLADSNDVLAKAYTGVAAAVNAPKTGKAEKPAAEKVVTDEQSAPAGNAVEPPLPVALTLSDVRGSLVSLRREQVSEILAGFSAAKLSEVKEADYAALISTAAAAGRSAAPVVQDPLL